MVIRPLTAADVELYRATRLRALATDPDAFGSNYEREAAFADADWIARMTGFAGRPGVVYAAVGDDGGALGVAGVGASEEPAEAVVWGMWVAPEARGQGVGGGLLDAALDWASEQRLATVLLAVMRDNDPARALYERYGFEPIANELPPSDPCADEVLMRRTV